VTLLCVLASQAELIGRMADPASWLSPTEQARWAGFSTEPRRQSFLAGRWLARDALRRWRCDGQTPVLEVADSGACRVAGDPRVYVSISHSGDHVACAVAALPVGVDVERLDRPRDPLGVAPIVHGAAQQQQLAALPEPARARAALQLWTLKEAWLKARERGLDFAQMRELAFDDDPEGDVAVAHAPGLVLSLCGIPALPPVIECDGVAAWQRLRSRALPAG
jgi:4'-phosphopantetheinyl transferase